MEIPEQVVTQPATADRSTRRHAVTGAFGYSGRYITERLLANGQRVRALTNSPNRTQLEGGHVEVQPLAFHDYAALLASLRDIDVLYNTYWVRFNTRDFNQTDAVANTRALFRAASEAGVRRVVHVSITNPSLDSPLQYFRGKAELEQALADSGLSYAILRPAVLFGGDDILINNIAWCLRKLPLILIPGDGEYRLQPIHVEDLAKLAVEQGRGTTNNTIDAIGPETFTYRELIAAIGAIIDHPRSVISAPPSVVHAGSWLIGQLVGDVMLTRDEIRGLMADLLHTDSPPAGVIRLTDWARKNADFLGVRYASELARRKNRHKPYDQL